MSFVPDSFDPPRRLAAEGLELEPLGPQHNESDHAAWTSSIDHIRSTPGYPDGSWPPEDGMTLEENLADLRRHADDFRRRAGSPSPCSTRTTTRTSSAASTCIPRSARSG